MGNDVSDVDVSRRHLGALLGLLGGAAGLSALSSCAPNARADGNEARALSAALNAGSSFVWVDTIGSTSCPSTTCPSSTPPLYNANPLQLRQLQGTAQGQIAVAQGFWAAGDGGGGIFYWDATTPVPPDDGGTIIVPTAAGGCWRRVFSGAIQVKWFGAMGDGQDHSNGAKAFDTGFLQNAIYAAHQRALQSSPPTGGLAIASTPAVDFGSGLYVVTGTLSIPDTRLSLFSDSGAGIVQAASTPVPILQFTDAYQHEIRGLRFVSGTNQIAIGQQSYPDATIIRITNCEFEASTGFAVLTTPPSGHGDIDGKLTIDGCKFFGCVGAVSTVCDVSEILDTWIETPVSAASQALQPMIVNGAGALFMHGVTGVTGALCSNAPQLHWIANNGSVYVAQSYIQGENGGIPFLFHYGGLPAEGSPGGLYNEGSSIVIRDSVVFCGLKSSANPNCAIITVVQGCPQRVILDGITGPAANGLQPILQSAGQYNLSAYVAQHPSAARYIKVSIDANLVSVNAGTVQPVDPALMPYLNPYETSPFPMGAQYGTPLQAPRPVSQASFTFALPVNVNGPGGFVAIVTVSANPNISGYDYRASASYLVAMTTAQVGGVLSDILSWAPLGLTSAISTQQCASDNAGGQCQSALGLPLPPGVYPAMSPSIASVQFDVGSASPPAPGVTNAGTGGGYAVRPSRQGAGGSLTVTWDSNASGVPVAFPAISIQPIHVTP